MHMRKHHENALILFGIAVCAGLLLSAPAVADSGQGLMALESGELLSFSLNEISATENGLKPFGVSLLSTTEDDSDAATALADDGNVSVAAPVLPDEENTSSAVPVTPDEEDARDTIPAPTGTGVPDPLTGADTEPTMPADPENGSRPAPAVDASPAGTGYDDERLAGLIETASIRLMRLSMEHAHALYLQDADASAIAADDLHAFSVRLLGEVRPLQVSPERQPVKDEFVRSVEAYSTASETLLRPTDAGGDPVPTAFRDMAVASESLEEVSRQAGEIQPTGTRASTMDAADTLAAGAPGVSAGTGPVQVAPPEKVLRLLDRYTYADPSGENMVSLLAESTRTATAYREVPTNASTAEVRAGEGRMFFLVVVKSTNLGHKGDSDLYTVETPGRDAFVLEYGGSTFTPLETPPFTSLGESFDRKSIERYESLEGYLYFDLPATSDLSGAILRADLGDAGTPAWDLGRELGEESTDANAV